MIDDPKDMLDPNDEGLRLDRSLIDEVLSSLEDPEDFIEDDEYVEASIVRAQEGGAPGEVVKHKNTGEEYIVTEIDPTSGVATVTDKSGKTRKIHKDYLTTGTIKRALDMAGPTSMEMGGTPAQAPAKSPAQAPTPTVEETSDASPVTKPQEEHEIEVSEPAAPTETPPAPPANTTISTQFLKEIFTDPRIAPLIVQILIDKLTESQIAEALPTPTLESLAEEGLTASLVRRKGFPIISALVRAAYSKKRS